MAKTNLKLFGDKTSNNNSVENDCAISDEDFAEINKAVQEFGRFNSNKLTLPQTYTRLISDDQYSYEERCKAERMKDAERRQNVKLFLKLVKENRHSVKELFDITNDFIQLDKGLDEECKVGTANKGILSYLNVAQTILSGYLSKLAKSDASLTTNSYANKFLRK